MSADNSLRVERIPAPIRNQVIDKLRRAIIAGEFKAGQRLIERELVEKTGVSRTSIREALIELAAEGLVTTTPNKGTAVAKLSGSEIRDLYEVRSALEGLAGRLFVNNATDAQRDDLRARLDEIEKLTEEGSSILEVKDLFYDVLFGGTGNKTLRMMASSLHARVMHLRARSLSLPGRPRQSVAELREILAAVDAGDADRAMWASMNHVKNAQAAALATVGD